MSRSKGTYALVLALDEETIIGAGRLGVTSFLKGYYVYLGSALGSLFPRLRRHLSGEGKPRWHIDYLRRYARAVEAWHAVSDERLECSWYRAVAGMPGAKIPVSGFGSSDCKCPSHPVHFSEAPSLEAFERKLKQMGISDTSNLARIPAG